MLALAEGGAYARALREVFEGLRPRALLAVSAHWQTPGPPAFTAGERPSRPFGRKGC